MLMHLLEQLHFFIISLLTICTIYTIVMAYWGDKAYRRTNIKFALIFLGCILMLVLSLQLLRYYLLS